MLNLNLFESRLERTIEEGQLVGVHWNSHKGVWSIVAMKSRKTTGLVLGYASEITLEDCSFKIDKSKQESVREQGTKDRHAFVVGKIKNFEYAEKEKSMYYNPFKVNSFVDAEKFFGGCGAVELENVSEVSMMHNGKPVVTYNV